MGQALVEDVPRPFRRRQFLALEQLRVHVHDENLFVPGSVMDPNMPARWQALDMPPAEIVIELFRW